LAMTAYSFWFYPWKFVWPSSLSPLYELPLRVDPLAPRFLGPMVAVISISLVLLALRRRWPAGLAAWAHSLIVLLPVSGLVHTGYQLAHDRYSYLSGLGLGLLVRGRPRSPRPGSAPPAWRWRGWPRAPGSRAGYGMTRRASGSAPSRWIRTACS